MAQSKQEIIDKILSFDYEKLAGWIRSRLHGDDPYFPIYDGYETNLSQFLTDAFNHIKNEEFRKNFIEILNELVTEFRKYTPGEIEENKEYIYELLILCGTIKNFENKAALFKIAKSGKLKGIRLRGTDLHLVLLTALLSYRMGGNYRFWVEQMQDDSNKYYTNAAYYALLKHRYRLDILFKQMGLFVERFKGDVVLTFGIEALFDYHEPEEIYGRFKGIESQLTVEQKSAVNDAFLEAGYDIPFKASPATDKQPVYKPLKTAVSVAGEKPLEYGTAETFQEKAGEIFERMGCDVQFNRQMDGHTIDIFIKRKKLFSNDFECCVCRCREGERKVNKEEVERFLAVGKAVEDCAAVIISEKGFTKGALETAKKHGIILKTLHDLETDLKDFYSQLEIPIQKMH